MRAALAGIVAVAAIGLVAGLVMSQMNPPVQHRFAVEGTTRL
jgi:hypothetical protein